MRTIKAFSLITIILFGFNSFAGILVDGEHQVMTKDSKVNWVGEKVTGKHTGTVELKNGNIQISEGELVGGYFEMDMTTILVTDLQGEYQQKLEGHLKSDDFFGVNSYPTAKFVITNVKKQEDGSYYVAGKMTIKDVTKQIEFTTNLEEKAGKMVASAEVIIDRADFNVRYGSGSFFDNLGDNMIYDNFTLNVNLTTD